MLFVLAQFGIGLGVEQLVELGDVVGLDLEEPAIAVWVLIDGLWSFVERRIHCNHFPTNEIGTAEKSLYGYDRKL